MIMDAAGVEKDKEDANVMNNVNKMGAKQAQNVGVSNLNATPKPSSAIVALPNFHLQPYVAKRAKGLSRGVTRPSTADVYFAKKCNTNVGTDYTTTNPTLSSNIIK